MTRFWIGCTSRLAFLMVLLLLASAPPAGAQTPKPWPDAPNKLTLKPVGELGQDSSQPKLANGTVVDPADWPASFFATLTGDESLSCTATLIGPRVLLAAAHCVTDGGTVSITRQGSVLSGTCERSKPGYPDPISADWLLCEMQQDVSGPYERISLNKGDWKHGRQILLAGYGCTRIGGSIDGKFRKGPAWMDKLPGETGGSDFRNWIYTRAAAADGNSFICPGDSGGAVFLEQAAADRRLVIAVNSHYDTGGQGISFLSALATDAGTKFIDDWRKAHPGLLICGLDNDAPDCR